MSNNWKTYKLSDALEIKYGKDHKKVQDGNIPIYGTGGIMRYGNQALYDKETILIPRKGSLNNIFYLNEPFWSVDTIFWSKINEEVAFPKYLFYNLKVLDFASMDVGSAIPSLTTELLKKIEIKLPSLQEQQSIASILSAIDDKIENNLAINKTLEEMAMALYKHWFVDFGPFQEGEFVESELGMIPKGWEVKKINELIDKVIDNRGKTPPISKEKTIFLLLETYQLSRNNLFPVVVKDSKAKYVTEEIYNTSKWFRKGHPQFMDVLFATVGNGIPNWSLMYENDGVCIAQNIVALRPKKTISSIFIRYSFESIRFLDQFDGYVITTAQPSIKLSDLYRINMIMPPNDVLINWTNLVTEYVEKIYNHYKENQTLTQLRDSLLPQLISGEVRLKEFQEKTENVM